MDGFRSESNSLTALALFVSSIAIDAFTAHDPLDGAGHAPTSLRATAVLLVACLASPPLRSWMVFEQRIAVGAALVAVACVGMHVGAETQRIGDASFVSLTFAGILYTFWVGGSETDQSGRARARRSKGAATFVQRETLTCLSLAAWLYSSCRIVVIGFRHPGAVSEYTHVLLASDGTESAARGYAYASSAGVAALLFGGAVGAGASTVLFLTTEFRAQGTAAGTLLLSAASMVQLAAAFLATLSQSEAMTELPAIWSEGACAVSSVCPLAYAARRLTLVNQCGGALWVNGLGTLVLAYAPSLRLQSRVQMLGTRRNRYALGYGAVGAIACCAALFYYLAFTGAEPLTDFACVAAVVAVFTAVFVDSFVGTTVFTLCLSSQLLTRWHYYWSGDAFLSLSHCYELQMVVLLALHLLVTAFSEIFWKVVPHELVDACDSARGVIAVAGTSTAAIVYLAAAAMAATYDGQLLDDALLRRADNRFARTAAAGILEYWLPLLVWLPLYGCRCEIELLSWRARAVAWYSSSIIPVLYWLSAFDPSVPMPIPGAEWTGTAPSIVGLCTVALVPWSVLAWA